MKFSSYIASSDKSSIKALSTIVSIDKQYMVAKRIYFQPKVFIQFTILASSVLCCYTHDKSDEPDLTKDTGVERQDDSNRVVSSTPNVTDKADASATEAESLGTQEVCNVFVDSLDNHVANSHAYILETDREKRYHAQGSDQLLGDKGNEIVTLYQGPDPNTFSTIDCTCTPDDERLCGNSEVGECEYGIQVCLSGHGWSYCKDYIQPVAEICDGKDNDCDGSIDEDVVGLGSSCDSGLEGVCAEGVTTCQDAEVRCIAKVSSSAEICDDQDNDCDGKVDEGIFCSNFKVCLFEDKIRISKKDAVNRLCTTIQLSPQTEKDTSALVGVSMPSDLMIQHAWTSELTDECGLDFNKTRARETAVGNGEITCTGGYPCKMGLDVVLSFADNKTVSMVTEFEFDTDGIPTCENIQWPVLSGEKYSVGDTVRLGTLIGYGRFEWIDDVPANVSSESSGGDVVFGTDLGVNVSLRNDSDQWLTYFFFGDTWPGKVEYWDGVDAAPDGNLYDPGYYAIRTEKGDTSHGIPAADISGYTSDNNPDDGIEIHHIRRNNEPPYPQACSMVGDDGYRSIFAPTVNLPCQGNQEGSGGGVPSGVVAIPNQTGDDTILISWYNTKFTSTPVQQGTYMLFSHDLGITWKAIRNGNSLGDAIPFSPRPDATVSRFSQVNALLVDAQDYQSGESSPCQLPLPDGADTRGLLLFAGGRPYRRSDIYLGFLSLAAIHQAVLADGEYDLMQHMVYFAGIGQGAGPGNCWSDLESDATPVVRTSDVTPFARIESYCNHRVFAGFSGAGEVVVRHIDMVLDENKKFDRLVLLLNNNYGVCIHQESADPCCGGTIDFDTHTCSGTATEENYSRLAKGNMGINLVTGDPLRPWIWNTKADDRYHFGDEVQNERPYAPLFIPSPIEGVGVADDIEDTGSACRVQPWTHDYGLHGYGPYIIEQYTRKSADGKGVDIYFPLSRWRGKNTAAELQNGPYRIDVFRTTIRPE